MNHRNTSETEELRYKYVKQFFIYHDYINAASSNSSFKSIDFQTWLTTTRYSEDKDECFTRMKVHNAVLHASSSSSASQR